METNHFFLHVWQRERLSESNFFNLIGHLKIILNVLFTLSNSYVYYGSAIPPFIASEPSNSSGVNQDVVVRSAFPTTSDFFLAWACQSKALQAIRNEETGKR
jgi:hypothetical protein